MDLSEKKKSFEKNVIIKVTPLWGKGLVRSNNKTTERYKLIKVDLWG